jgi:uncharacterized protein YbaR (Trm112 family)
MEVRLLDLLVCPICKGPLEYLRLPAGERPQADTSRRPPPEGDEEASAGRAFPDERPKAAASPRPSPAGIKESGGATLPREQHELVCRGDRLAFPVRDGIPVMLEDQARTLEPAA